MAFGWAFYCRLGPEERVSNHGRAVRPEMNVTVGDDKWPEQVRFLDGSRAGEAFALNGSEARSLFRTDFDTLDGLQVNRYGDGGGVTLVPDGLAQGDAAGRYESRDNRDHIATPYLGPRSPDTGLFFFSAWVHPAEGRRAPALWLQDENFTFLSRAQVRLRRPDGWILLVGFAEKTGATQVRLVVMEQPGTVSLIDKMLLVEASGEDKGRR